MTEPTPKQLVSERMRFLIGVAKLAFSNIDKVLDPLDEMCDEVAQLETENEQIWGEKNHWWRLACVRGTALQEISEMIEKPLGKWTPVDAAIMHEKAEEALGYEPSSEATEGE